MRLSLSGLKTSKMPVLQLNYVVKRASLSIFDWRFLIFDRRFEI